MSHELKYLCMTLPVLAVFCLLLWSEEKDKVKQAKKDREDYYKTSIFERHCDKQEKVYES